MPKTLTKLTKEMLQPAANKFAEHLMAHVDSELTVADAITAASDAASADFAPAGATKKPASPGLAQSIRDQVTAKAAARADRTPPTGARRGYGV
jgi:hypothetical protein